MKPNKKQNPSSLCIAAKCRCGNVLAFSMIIGHVSITGEMTNAFVEVVKQGGSLEVVDTAKQDLNMTLCNCEPISAESENKAQMKLFN